MSNRADFTSQKLDEKRLLQDNDTGESIVPTTSKKASVEIVSSLCFQKFRYEGENRPGKKYQDKDFMILKLSHLKDRVVRVVIVCTDATNHETIHPNGLVGAQCHHGIFDNNYAITKDSVDITIPFIRISRMKIKKTAWKKLCSILSERAACLQSPYKERFQSQCAELTQSTYRDFDTNKVCLGVIVTDETNTGDVNGTLHAISSVVMNASQKTKLDILKLSTVHVPASTGCSINIFTTECSPPIKPDIYQVYVTWDSEQRGLRWESNKYVPKVDDILYQKVISYQVPCFEPDPELHSPVTVDLHLACPQSNLQCTFPFYYVPKTETQRKTLCAQRQCHLQGNGDQNVLLDHKQDQGSHTEDSIPKHREEKLQGEARAQQLCKQ